MNLFSDRSFLLQALIKSHLCSRHCVSHCKQESENTRVSSFLKLIVYQKKKKIRVVNTCRRNQNLNGFSKDRYSVLEDTITVWDDFASD